MRSLLVAALALSGTIFVSTETQTPDAIALATSVVERLVKGEFASIVAQFDDKVRAALPEEKLRATWTGLQGQLGGFKQQLAVRTQTKDGYRIVLVSCEFQRARADVMLVVNPAGRISGLSVRPPTSTVEFTDAFYVNRAAFTERDVVVDAGGWPLPGTLSVPVGAGPWPAVVLVHGSGPNDRDESVGPNKPFRDLAHGLASSGVAVLRYEKRTRQHGPKVAPLREFTVKDEVVDDAVAAVRLLGTTAGIDSARVFVLGHSLGGMLAPRIAVAGGSAIRGLVILAGAVRSLEQSVVDQFRYLSQLDGSISPEEQKQIDLLERMAAQVKTLKPSDPPLAASLFSAPTSYWIDLRGYDPPAEAARLKVPMLLLQGARDYQVTTDDFARWKSALGARSDVTLKSYPALNHLFIAGSGPSAPAEYDRPGHVEAEVVRDVADWIVKTK